jgi:FlaG/FlaF family flagellin (archaellin)
MINITNIEDKKMNKYQRKIWKNTKAFHPVLATIILIAVTVAVSVVVAAWMGGMTIGLMGNVEQVQTTNAQCPDANTIILTLRNTGEATVTISSTQATVDGKAIPITSAIDGFDIAKGTSKDFTSDLTGVITMQQGTQYSIRLVTEKGTAILYTVTYNA